MIRNIHNIHYDLEAHQHIVQAQASRVKGAYLKKRK